MMRIRLALSCFVVAVALAFVSVRARADSAPPPADAKAADGKAAAKPADGKSDSKEDEEVDTNRRPIEKFVAPKAPSRHDECGLSGARSDKPFVTGANLLQQSWDDDSKVGRALLASGDYAWVDLKECGQYHVVAKLFVERAPKSDDTRYWLGRAAELADLLSGPFLDDEALALEKIAHSGKWFSHKIVNGATMEFPMAMERIRFSATVVDYDGFAVLTLEQEAA